MAAHRPKPGAEAAVLRQSETFASFSRPDIGKLVRTGYRVSLPANWPLIHERTPGDACYIVLSGRVAVYSGRDRVTELGPGEMVGEVSLRHGRLRSATVSTVEPVEVLRIEGEGLARLLREIPAFAEALDASVEAHGGEPSSS